MNRKIMLLPLLALAVLPVLAASNMYGPDADRIGKQFAADNPGATIGIHTLEAASTESQDVGKAQLIIEGTVTEVRPYWKVIRDDIMPRIFTEFTVRVDDVIKGDLGLSGKTVSVAMSGGSLDGITMETEAAKMTKGTQAILMLGKDTESVFGDAYSPISVSKSIYIIKDGYAENKVDDRSGDKDEVKKRISDSLK